MSTPEDTQKIRSAPAEGSGGVSENVGQRVPSAHRARPDETVFLENSNLETAKNIFNPENCAPRNYFKNDDSKRIIGYQTYRPKPPLGKEIEILPDGMFLPSDLEMSRIAHARGEPWLSLAEFTSWGWNIIEPSTPLVWNWHLDFLCAHIEAVLRGPGHGKPWVQNLLINIPPGTMKSLILSVFAPAWVWLWRPSWRSVFSSANERVALRDSLKCRQLVESKEYQETFKPDWKLASDQNAKSEFATTKGGRRLAITTGQKVTGDRADALFIDDPHDAAEVLSKASRDTVRIWWTQAFRNRVAQPETSTRICIMQRLHEDDLSTTLLEEGWSHICLPQEYERDGAGVGETFLGVKDPRTEEGELLFPGRFTPGVLAEEKKALGSSGYAGQHQQRPSAATGNKFQRSWWRFYSRDGQRHPRPRGCDESPPRVLPINVVFEEVIGSWDCTFKGGDENDFVVGITVGRIGADKFVLARHRERMGLTQTQRAILRQKADWPTCYEIVVEDKANGSAVVETLGQAISGIVPVEPKGGKEARAAAIEPQVEAGNIYLPEGAEWLEEWIDEFAAFPKGKHDDQVDALSQALIKLSDEEVMTARLLLGL